MGLLGSKKTLVSSTVYNLAGDEADRPNYLKTTVIGATLGSEVSPLADTLAGSYLKGPGIRQRSYYSWAARSGYNTALGLSATGLGGSTDLNVATVASQIPHDPGQMVLVQRAQISPADYEFWAEQWLCDHEPATLNTAWTADHNDVTNEVTITRVGGLRSSFVPVNFGKTGLYVLAAYNLATTGTVSAPVIGATAGGASFPSTTGWTLVSSSTLHHFDLGGWDETHEVYSKTVYLGDDGSGRLINRTSWMYQDQLAHDGGGGLSAVLERTWRTDTQDTTLIGFSTPKVFIYRIGWGNLALDAMVGAATPDNSFFPPIPVRIDNQFVSTSHMAADYDWAAKAYKKLTNGKFDSLVSSLADNPDLKDLDFVFVVPGVSLNVQENACRQYLYNFLRHCMLTTAISEADYELWQTHQADADAAAAIWQTWFNAQTIPSDPLYGTPQPPRWSYTNRPTNTVQVVCKPELGFDMRIQWQLIQESTGGGLAKLGAVKGEVWFEKGAVAAYSSQIWGGSLGSLPNTEDDVETLTLFWQVDETHWKKLIIQGLKHFNFVYKGKSVEISAFEALDDPDESGFIFPIHHGVWRDMSLVTTTQMATASVFMVINCYKIVKKKWYQTGLFKIIVFVVLVAVAIITASPQLIAAYGTIGAATAATVGITLGAMAAAILGAAIVALAQMVLLKLLTMATTAVFGPKWGALIAAVAVVVGGAYYQSGYSVSQALQTLSRADNLILLTESVGNGFAHMIAIDAQRVVGKIQDTLTDYQDKSQEVSALYAQNIGYDRGLIDPTALMDFTVPAPTLESQDAFLGRTLMTGSDISDLSIGLITRFTELTLQRDLPL